MYEFELAHELEAIPEISEGEWETAQSEAETEAFFGRLARLARRAIQSPALRRIGLAAARSALGGLGPAGKAAAGLLPQQEAEFEAEWESLPELEMEYEAETELNPVRRIYPDALLEHLGHVAAEAESEAEVAAIARRMVPLVTRAMPGVARIIRRNAPQLARGLANVARTLGRSPTTRPLLRVLPTILRRTAANLSRQAARAGVPSQRRVMGYGVRRAGQAIRPLVVRRPPVQASNGVVYRPTVIYRPASPVPVPQAAPVGPVSTGAAVARAINPQVAVRTLARQTQMVLGRPDIVVHIYKRSRALDRYYHRNRRGL